MRQLGPETELGTLRVDRLVRVWRRDGTDSWVLVHIEVQSQRAGGFARRMFSYYCRIFVEYGRHPVSLAILADESPGWRPAEYASEEWDCNLHFGYPVVKLLDWRARREELEASDNPFATVVLAHLAAQDTRKDMDARQRAKLGLIRRLYDRGYDRQRVLDLFRFIDWLLTLPVEREREVRRELEAIEGERKMPYITSMERISRQEGLEQGLERGLEQGRMEGKREALQRLAQARFGPVPDALEKRIPAAAEAALDELLDRLIVAARIEDL